MKPVICILLALFICNHSFSQKQLLEIRYTKQNRYPTINSTEYKIYDENGQYFYSVFKYYSENDLSTGSGYLDKSSILPEMNGSENNYVQYYIKGNEIEKRSYENNIMTAMDRSIYRKSMYGGYLFMREHKYNEKYNYTDSIITSIDAYNPDSGDVYGTEYLITITRKFDNEKKLLTEMQENIFIVFDEDTDRDNPRLDRTRKTVYEYTMDGLLKQEVIITEGSNESEEILTYIYGSVDFYEYKNRMDELNIRIKNKNWLKPGEMDDLIFSYMPDVYTELLRKALFYSANYYFASGKYQEAISLYLDSLFFADFNRYGISGMFEVYMLVQDAYPDIQNIIESSKKELKSEAPGYYSLYNVACSYAKMLPDTDKDNFNYFTELACLYIDAALKMGFPDQKWILNDSDLDNIKTSSEFTEIIKKYNLK